MGIVYQQGQVLGRGDLDIYLTNGSGNPSNAYTISYAIYYVDPVSCQEVLIGPDSRIPVNPAVGEYYAALQVPGSAAPGTYRVRWLFQETSISPQVGAVQEFGVVSSQVQTSANTMTGCMADLVRKMRVMTRDNNPSKNYSFRPPEGEGTIGCYNQVFGYVWTDEEFIEYLNIALDKWNLHPPETEELKTVDMVCQQKPSWRAALLWGALVNAAQALAYNWTVNEFSYSIGGISLDIQRTSSYMDLKRNAEEQWDKMVESKARTTKFLRGLQQPRFGRGVRSAFGPYVGRGVLSPRNFVAVLLAPTAATGCGLLEALQHAHHLSTLLS
jgi:hypothetical protein